jgi:hypothetical protein
MGRELQPTHRLCVCGLCSIDELMAFFASGPFAVYALVVTSTILLCYAFVRRMEAMESCEPLPAEYQNARMLLRFAYPSMRYTPSVPLSCCVETVVPSLRCVVHSCVVMCAQWSGGRAIRVVCEMHV